MNAGRLRTGRPAVLVLVDFYPPAFAAGGPTRSVPRIVELLADELTFSVVTSDRDLGATARLDGIAADRWTPVGGGRAKYLSPGLQRLRGVVASMRAIRHDVLYLNSLFSFHFTIVPLALRALRLVPRPGLVIAPRGELDDSALAIKRIRKHAVLWLVRTLRLASAAVWHAATPTEGEAIRRRIGPDARVLIARDLPNRSSPTTRRPPKVPGELDVAFLGRVAPMKNLDFALAVLAAVKGRVTFSVYGPLEDQEYWAECQRLAAQLPPAVTMHYQGVRNPDDVTEILAAHHLFFLPSRAESYGHAINEALVAGCPVLISDQTPWRNLEVRKAGWDLPLARPDAFVRVIERCIAMSQQEFEAWSSGARALGREVADDPDLDAAYRALFSSPLSERSLPT
jgi:glycosyltransferase involved in cell wall biosynthesis